MHHWSNTMILLSWFRFLRGIFLSFPNDSIKPPATFTFQNSFLQARAGTSCPNRFKCLQVLVLHWNLATELHSCKLSVRKETVGRNTHEYACKLKLNFDLAAFITHLRSFLRIIRCWRFIHENELSTQSPEGNSEQHFQWQGLPVLVSYTSHLIRQGK